jgi:hypothetical protein
MKSVYFIKPVGMTGPVKIGCARDVDKRLDELMSWSPVDLEVLATVPGDFNLENRIHRMFFLSHRRHEWFDWSPELGELIRLILDGKFTEAIVPDDNRPLWWERHIERRWGRANLAAARAARATSTPADQRAA